MKLPTSRFAPWLIAGTLGVLLGLIAGLLLSRWSALPGDFADLKLKDLLGVAVTLTVALLISRHVNTRLRSESLLHGIVGDVVGTAERGLQNLLETWQRYADSDDRPLALEAEVHRHLEAVSLALLDLNELEGKGVIRKGVAPHADLRRDYLDLKRALTAHPFAARVATNDRTFDSDRRQEAGRLQRQLKRKLFRLRIDLVG